MAEKSRIYLKVNGETQVYASGDFVTHAQAAEIIASLGVVPDGAILVTHV